MKIPISNRLLCCAELVRPGARVADVGCDHGYLGIYLLANHIASAVAAMDLREAPLEKARQNARRFGTSEQMSFAVCNGLDGLAAGEADTVICAGMGGETIALILDACQWTRDERVSLILQPQSGGNDLRRWLGENRFSILRERLVRDGGFLYFVMEARYGGGEPLSPGAQYVSPALLAGGGALLGEYFDRVIRGIQKAVDGIARSSLETEQRRMGYYEQALREILEMRERYDNNPGNL